MSWIPRRLPSPRGPWCPSRSASATNLGRSDGLAIRGELRRFPTARSVPTFRPLCKDAELVAKVYQELEGGDEDDALGRLLCSKPECSPREAKDDDANADPSYDRLPLRGADECSHDDKTVVVVCNRLHTQRSTAVCLPDSSRRALSCDTPTTSA